MPKFYAEGVLKIVESNSFVDSATADKVEFYKNCIATTDGGMLILNSKEDFSQYLEKHCIFGINAFNKDGSYKLSIKTVKAI